MVDVVCAIIIQQGKALAAQKPPGSALAGFWEFPGGKIRPGEGEQVCVVREIEEELGLFVLPLKRLEESVFTYPDKAIRLIPYLCLLKGGELVAREHSSVKWCGRKELGDLAWCEADVPVARQVMEDWEEML